MSNIVKRVLLKLLQKAMGYKVEWSEEELALMDSLLHPKDNKI